MDWKKLLKPNIINIPLFIIFLFIFLPLPVTTCESLFLGYDFNYFTYWFDTTMKATSPEYEMCGKISFVFIILVSYLLASSIAYWYKKK